MNSKTSEAMHDQSVQAAPRLRRYLLTLLTSACLMLAIAVQQSQAEQAAELTTHKMILSHHEFEPWDFTPKAGDRIEITNTSDIAHSVYITYPDGKVVTLGDVQLPGQFAVWEVPADGEYLFKCWIHPVINAKMKVQSKYALASEDG
jgi:plastocyanin